ncbi:uncharacterized protein K444DRAFT_581191 [Hyaloscypha bicolor E]|uniref:Rhodopsin domain-containing protein n=1 Tax=Hyaloscypha bicolor E TaxID=1095630 RepID=A0A2J6TTK9_9HELO|nr:uncharacterized protein K444DRAFT_581191 [Hyaloscypha bicolor E]PMD66336.1 hypothetical protein K444DRAFT_581191 [Hyaloscypha bicolor E]
MTDNQQPTIVSVNLLVGILAGIAIILRVLARRIRNLPLESDDITIIVALPLSWSICACNIVASTYGLGRHIDTLTSADIIHEAQIFFASQLLWAVAIPIIKISILLLYIRIFGVLSYFRYTAYILGVFLFLWGIMVVFVVSLTCRPLKYTWDKSGEGSCINATVFYIVGSGLNVITDFITLFLPLHAVWYLQSSIQQKLLLTGIFLLGSLTCAISLARWCSLFQIHGSDQTWDLTLPTIWSAAEACLGIVAACLPTLRPLFPQSRTPDDSQTNHSSPPQGLQSPSSKNFRRSFSMNQNFLQLQDFSAKATALRLQALPDNSTSNLVDSSTKAHNYKT